MSAAQPTTAYRDALRALEAQQRARLSVLVQQTEAMLHSDWQRGMGAAASLYKPVLDEYAKALTTLRAEMDDPAAKLSLDWLTSQNSALKSIENSVRASALTYGNASIQTVEDAQLKALNRGLQDAENLTQEALFPASQVGVDPTLLFNRPNPDAIAQMVGRAGNGHPLGDLFSAFPQEATSGARQALLLGMATGANPVHIAQGISQAVGISRSRAITIARTEVLGSYRQAAHETYRANSDVLGYWLWSAGGNNPCAMCAGMDGTLHDLSEDLSDHPCGKCAPIPVTKSWSDILGPYGIDASDLEETSIGAPGNYTSISEKFDSYSPQRQREIIGTQTGYEAYKRGEVTLKDFIGVRPGSDGFPSSYYQRSLKEMQIPTRQASRLVQPSPEILDKLRLGTLRYTDLGKITPDALMPAWAKSSDASRIVYQILRNGLPYDMTAHERGLLLVNMEQMLRETLPTNVRAAVERQLDALGAKVERLTAAKLNDLDTLAGARAEVRDAQKALRDAIEAVRSDFSRNPQGLLSSALQNDGRITQAQARLNAAQANMRRLAQDARGGLHAMEPMEGRAVELQAERDALTAQRDITQTKLDALSAKWEQLVWKQVEFDPEEDEEEIAKLEAQILKTEDQQGVLIRKLEQFDQRISATDAKIADELHATPSDRVVKLRNAVDDAMARRENIYAEQHELLAQQDRLTNLKNPEYARMAIARAEHQAKLDLYRQTLDKSDPEVKAYLKASEAWTKNESIKNDAKAEMERIERSMDAMSVAGQKGTGAWQQAKEDYDAAAAKYNQAVSKSTKLWQNLWSKGNVYKPELDSIGGFESRFANPITGHAFVNGRFTEIRTPRWTAQEIANHPLVVAARQRIAGLDKQIADIKAQIQELEKPIKDINRQIERDLAKMREINATLSDGAKAFDTMRPFNDVIDLPEGHQLPNALMNKIDYRMHEPREVTKSRIIDNIANKLKDSPAWQAYVERMPLPDNLGVYHGYIPNYASAKDTKSAKLLADIMRKWGVGYKPGSPMWVAMQMATNEEFGLDAEIHVVSESGLKAGAEFYAQDGAALRALLRAMYENTQQWFAENGIEEAEVYRGFGWTAGKDIKSFDAKGKPIYIKVNPNLPKNIEWGPMEAQNYGVADMELNPFQSFSADINISQGTGGGGGGFAGAGFSGGNDYSLLIGANVPVDRILSTAQTGFGAKLESEVIVMGRATDTVSYRAGSQIPDAILRRADEQVVGDRAMLYTLKDGTELHVAANADGTFTISYLNGPEPKIGGGYGTATLKLGGSRVYKTEAGVNKALTGLRVGNTYVAPPKDLAIFEGKSAAEREVLERAMSAQINRIPADATVADIQDFVKAQLPNIERVELETLDPQAARLIANATTNLAQEIPGIADNLWRIKAETTYTESLAYVPRDGLSLIINADKWTDLAGIAERTPTYFAQGWWVSQTPEQIIGHEIGHLVQLNYKISNEAWQGVMDRVAAAGGNPLVSTYAGNKVEESFAETFALLIYGQPTDDQMAIAKAMAQLLKDNGIDYNKLRKAVGAARLDLGE